ncbi:MAG: hypothetical protein C4576_19765 [Desulfobacteraceae bacterium]|nr:MAG: hypothetical protein C4576_19765 [Desulfobacteraceae bacterium]
MAEVHEIRSKQIRKNPLFPNGPWTGPEASQEEPVDLKRLEVLIQTQGKRLDALEEKTEKRQKPKPKVIKTHHSMVNEVYGGKCPCCMGALEDPEVDHFSSRAWSGLHDTWLICGQCNGDLYRGALIRAEVQPRFATYQAHMKRFIGGEQLSLVPRMTIRPVKPRR